MTDPLQLARECGAIGGCLYMTLTPEQLALFYNRTRAEAMEKAAYICENGEGDYGDRAEAIRALIPRLEQ